MTDYGVPDEAVRDIAQVWQDRATGEPGLPLTIVYRDEIRDILAAAAEAGWVLVPGPVQREWANRYDDGSIRVRHDEHDARGAAVDIGGVVVSHLVTEWRPTEEV